MNDNYSKRELDFHFDKIKEDLGLILSQTTKTNGRVTCLEAKVEKQTDEFSKWKYIVLGGLGVASLMGAPGLFTIVKAFSGM